MKIKPFSEQGKYTIFDNCILDNIMPALSPTGWKVLCFIIRKTVGWHKNRDAISFSQIKTGTGIKTSHTLNSAIVELETMKIVIVTRNATDTNIYFLNLDFEIEVASLENALDNKIASAKNALEASAKNALEASAKNAHTKHSIKQINTIGKSDDLPPQPADKELPVSPLTEEKPKPKTELFNYFTDYTKIPKPTNGEVRYWWARIGIIYTLAGEDVPTGKKLIKQAVDKLRGDDLTVSDPGSLIKTIRALIANGAGKKVRMTAV